MVMRSIRLSLVVYFLLLLTVALGAICWPVYRLAAAALDERYQAAQRLVHNQYEVSCKKALMSLDHRLLRHAHYVAAMARPPIHVEATYPVGLVGLAVTPAPHLHAWLWASEGIAPPGRPRAPGEAPSVAEQLFRYRSAEINIDAAEDWFPDVKRDDGDEASTQTVDHGKEYFQVFVRENSHVTRSQSLLVTDTALPIDGKQLETLLVQPPHERFHYDTVRGPEGADLRCVTVLASLQRPAAQRTLPPPRDTARDWDCWAHLRGRSVAKAAPGFGKAPPPMFFGRIWVQYAMDTRPTTALLSQYADQRDQQLVQLQADTDNQLHSLQRQLWWIALATFALTLAGGYLLLRLGLMPMARLSDAVSEVSERDFRLKIDPAQLPVELKPIAQRLSLTLEQLGRAFDREKQAAADISHELRTPLAALLTTVEVGLRKPRTVQEYTEILEDCRLSGEQMAHLVERLLALARLDAGAVVARTRTIDAGELALQCADLIRPLARAKDLTITAHVAPPLPAETDPDKLREVLTNLLHNAVEYNRPGGTIELSMDRRGDILQIEVRDTGIGIRSDVQARIFERFFRADPSRYADTPHAGLGLAIVKSYIDLLGGTITVESTPGVGTTFRVSWPAPAPAGTPRLALA